MKGHSGGYLPVDQNLLFVKQAVRPTRFGYLCDSLLPNEMTTMKTLFSLLTALCLTGALFAQLETHIPQDVDFVLTWNPRHLDKKVPLNKVQEMQMWEMGVSQLAATMAPDNEELLYQFINAPSDFGIDGMGSIYVIGKQTDAGMQSAMLFSVTDQTKLEKFLLDAGMMEGTPEVKKDFRYWDTGSGSAVAYSNNTGIIGNVALTSDAEEDFDFDFDVDGEDESEAEEEAPVLAAPDVAGWLDALMRTTSNNLINNADYRRTKEKTYDMGFYVDYAYVNNLQQSNNLRQLSALGGMSALTDMLNGMYDGTFLGGGLNFLPGKIQVDMKYYSTPKMERFFEQSTEHKFKKKLVRYLKGDELMGFYHFNFDMEDTGDGMKTLYKDAARSFPEYGEAAATAMEIVGLFIDEQQLYELLPGQAIIGLTGVETVERMKTVTEYDDDFNAIEVEKMVSEPLPQFTAVLQTADEKSMLKFMRMGNQLGVLENMGAYWKVTSDELPMGAYAAIVKDAVIITTDADLVTNRLGTGYRGDLGVSKDQLKMMKDASSLFYLDVEQMVKQGMSAADGEMAMAMMGVGMVSDRFKSIQVHSPADQENGFLTSFIIEMTDEETNALEQLLELLNMGASMMMGGDRT